MSSPSSFYKLKQSLDQLMDTYTAWTEAGGMIKLDENLTNATKWEIVMERWNQGNSTDMDIDA